MTNVEKLDALESLIQKTQPRRAWAVTGDFDVDSDLDLEYPAIIFKVRSELTAYKLSNYYLKMGLDAEIQNISPDVYHITVKEKNNG